VEVDDDNDEGELALPANSVTWNPVLFPNCLLAFVVPTNILRMTRNTAEGAWTCFCNRLKSIVRSCVYAKEYTIYLKSIVRS